MKMFTNKAFLFPVILLAFALLAAFLAYPLIRAIEWPPDRHFVLLANQFLKFNPELEPTGLPRGDIAAFFDRRDIYFGPLPALLLVPAVWLFGRSFPQEILGPVALLLSFILTYRLGRRFHFPDPDSLWLAIFFVFSTVLLPLGLVTSSAGLVQVIGTVLILLAVTQYYQARRGLIIGLFIALAGMTRATYFLAAAFFVFEFLFKRFKLKQLVLLFVPIIISLILLGAYNYKRFRNPFETGYQYNVSNKNYPLANNLKYGLSSFKYLPTNLYSLLLKTPSPVLENPGAGFLLKFPYLKFDPWGVAIWVTSPLFLILLVRNKKDNFLISTLATSILVALPSLTFFSIGYAQTGYRYSLDFLPFLFLLLLARLAPKLTGVAKFLIAFGVIFNALFLTSVWNVYPLLGIY